MTATVTVPLSRGLVARIDAGDADMILTHKWYAMKRGKTFYAVRNVRRPDGTRTALLMHRFLLDATDAEVYVDHRDGDGLNNQRGNLRFCNQEENNRNTSRRRDNGVGFKGVTYNRKHDAYYARIHVDGRTRYLGHYKTPEEAHLAYVKAAAQYFGDFARFD